MNVVVVSAGMTGAGSVNAPLLGGSSSRRREVRAAAATCSGQGWLHTYPAAQAPNTASCVGLQAQPSGTVRLRKMSAGQRGLPAATASSAAAETASQATKSSAAIPLRRMSMGPLLEEAEARMAGRACCTPRRWIPASINSDERG
jgi:hypothetical protein